jgi:hypothetical protein
VVCDVLDAVFGPNERGNWHDNLIATPGPWREYIQMYIRRQTPAIVGEAWRSVLARQGELAAA